MFEPPFNPFSPLLLLVLSKDIVSNSYNCVCLSPSLLCKIFTSWSAVMIALHCIFAVYPIVSINDIGKTYLPLVSHPPKVMAISSLWSRSEVVSIPIIKFLETLSLLAIWYWKTLKVSIQNWTLEFLETGLIVGMFDSDFRAEIAPAFPTKEQRMESGNYRKKYFSSVPYFFSSRYIYFILFYYFILLFYFIILFYFILFICLLKIM